MWKPIADLPQIYSDTRRMFVARAKTTQGSAGSYVTDPYCVWYEDVTDQYARWPHPFPPTEFMELPD